VERAALAAFCTWRFLQTQKEPSPPPQEEEVPPSTPVKKPAPAPSGPLSAIDLVKVACSTRKRARDEEEVATSEEGEGEEEMASAATPQAKHAKPREAEGASRKPKLVAMVGGVAMLGSTNEWCSA
jgi:hypothetical protein